MLTKKQSAALWFSIEHWFENWEDPENAMIGAGVCACCVAFDADYDCQGCPIAEKVGMTRCRETPWVYVDAGRKDTQAWSLFDEAQKRAYRNSIEREYAFLVDVALED